MAARLARADAELAAVDEFDHVVRNVDIDVAAAELGALIGSPQSGHRARPTAHFRWDVSDICHIWARFSSL